MRKEDKNFVIRQVRKPLMAGSNIDLKGFKFVVNRLNLLDLNDEEVRGIENEVNDFLVDRIRYFERRDRKDKVREYESVRKSSGEIFECFLSKKEEYLLETQYK